MIPEPQERAVDPFSSYDSDNVNKLTRIITGKGGIAKIVRDEYLKAQYVATVRVPITSGICIKDDVLIDITQDQEFDITDPENYIIRDASDPKEMDGPFPSVGYLVLTYQYSKSTTPSIATIRVLKHIDDFNPAHHVFLAKLIYQSALKLQVNGVYQDDIATNVNAFRPMANFTEPYTDIDARIAQLQNPITEHKPSDPSNWNSVITSSAIDGSIGYQRRTDFPVIYEGLYWNVHYVNGQLVIDHDLDRYPIVQILEDSSGNVIKPGSINFPTRNQMIISFDEEDPTPTVWVIYH